MGNDKHALCTQSPDGTRFFSVLTSSPESIDAWFLDLHKRNKGRIAIALELFKGPIVYAFKKYDFVRLFPVKPSSFMRAYTNLTDNVIETGNSQIKTERLQVIDDICNCQLKAYVQQN